MLKTQYGGLGCCIERCQETLSKFARDPKCRNCRASIGHWRARDPNDVVEYRRKLKVRDNRMAEVGSTPVRKRKGTRSRRK